MFSSERKIVSCVLVFLASSFSCIHCHSQDCFLWTCVLDKRIVVYPLSFFTKNGCAPRCRFYYISLVKLMISIKSGAPPLALLMYIYFDPPDGSTYMHWAEARIKITRMTLTIKLDRNWSSFQLANNTPPLSVTGSVIAPSARMNMTSIIFGQF